MCFFRKRKKAKLAKQEAERIAAAQAAREAEQAAEAAAKRTMNEMLAAKAAQEQAAAQEVAEKQAAEAAAKRSEAAKKAAATRAANKAAAEQAEQQRIAAETAQKERIAAEKAAIKGHVVIKPSRDGRFVYVIYAGNKQVIAKSAQTYASVANCKSAVESVAKIAKSVPIEDQTLASNETFKYPKFELYLDNGDKYRFRLCASNGQNLLACTQGYTQKASCKNGIQSVITNCAGEIEVDMGNDA